MFSRLSRNRPAFTLVELLVVIGIIALLIAVLLPVLGRARDAANTAKCLSNMRQLQLAQAMYAGSNRGWLVQAGMAERGASADEARGWFTSLQKYSSTKLLARCPSDASAYWDGATLPVTVPNRAAQGQIVQRGRRSSYGINVFLDMNLCPWGRNQSPAAVPPGGLFTKITQVRYASRVIQFIEMARDGDFAIADHAHVDQWEPPAWSTAAVNGLALNAHGGKVAPAARANYSFLDGHAETLAFNNVFIDFKSNRFDPSLND